MIKGILKHTPQIGIAIVGLASALLVLEIKRLPAVNFVEYEIFAPLPYLCEALLLGLVALIYLRAPHRKIAHRKSNRLIVSVLTVVFTTLMLMGVFDQTSVELLLVQCAYRFLSAFMFLLWGERLYCLGARVTALSFACACVVSGAFIILLAMLYTVFAQYAVIALPFISALCFVLYGPKRTDEEPGSAREEPEEGIIPFSLAPKKKLFIAIGLIALPLLCRGPVVSTQSSWLPFQGDTTVSFLMQFSIGFGVILAGIVCFLIMKYAWNRNFILVYEFFVFPVTFLAFYISQAAVDLWPLYLLIVDATYKVSLFFLFTTPFLFSRAKSPLVPLFAFFAFMILSRAIFSALYIELSSSVFVVITVVSMLVMFMGGAILILLYIQTNLKQFTSDSSDTEASSSQSTDASEKACEALTLHYSLTKRESEILLLLIRKNRAPYIAEKLVLSKATVKTHMRNLYAKLDVHSQTELQIHAEAFLAEAENDSNVE